MVNFMLQDLLWRVLMRPRLGELPLMQQEDGEKENTCRCLIPHLLLQLQLRISRIYDAEKKKRKISRKTRVDSEMSACKLPSHMEEKK